MSSSADAGRVSGYFRKNGTYVAPYYRSSPGSSSTSTGTGVPCGNSYISAGDVCHIGTSPTASKTFSSCAEARASGFSNMVVGDAGYSDALDRDSDGIACESGGSNEGVSSAPSVPTQPVKAQPVTAGSTVHTNTGANLRSGPSATTSKLSVLARGAALTLQSCSGNWCKVTVSGKSGYVIATAIDRNPSTTAARPIATVPVTTATSGSCPHFELQDSGIVIDVPANFPNPATQKTVSHLKCGGYSFDYTGDEYQTHKKISISGPSWQTAWKLISQGDLARSLDIDTVVHLTILDGVAAVSPALGGTISRDAVLGLAVAGGKLQPVVFDGKVTPRKLGQGANHFYMKGSSIYGDYVAVDIDTIRNTVVLTPSPDAL